MFKFLFTTGFKPRYPLVPWRSKGTSHKNVLPYKQYIIFNKYRQLLEDNLNINEMAAVRILMRHPYVFNIPKNQLIAQCKMCLELNVDIASLHKDAKVFIMPARKVENIVRLYQDVGVPKTKSINVSRFSEARRLPIFLFKAFLNVPPDNVVAENFLSVIQQPQEGVQPLEIPSEQQIFTKYHNHCLRWYLQWKLNLTDEDSQELKRMLVSLRNRSFSVMEQLFDIYQNEIGLTIKEIIHHRCLEMGSVVNLRQIIDEKKVFYGNEMKKLIKSRPVLCKMEYDNVVQVIKVLDKYDYAEISIQRYPEILLFPAADIEFRVQEIDRKPELRVLKNNLKSMNLVLRQFNQSQLRLSYLRYLNIKNPTVRILSAGGERFERFLEDGKDKTRAAEIAQSFKKVLKLQPREITDQLQRHPYWSHIDLLSMHDTLKFLLNEQFRLKDINKNLQIILYSREKIAETLDKLKTDKKSCSKSEFLLSLCLYEIEREFHFSGDGVWRQESLIPRRSKPNNTTDKELSDYSDTETEAENEKADANVLTNKTTDKELSDYSDTESAENEKAEKTF